MQPRSRTTPTCVSLRRRTTRDKRRRYAGSSALLPRPSRVLRARRLLLLLLHFASLFLDVPPPPRPLDRLQAKANPDFLRPARRRSSATRPGAETESPRDRHEQPPAVEVLSRSAEPRSPRQAQGQLECVFHTVILSSPPDQTQSR